MKLVTHRVRRQSWQLRVGGAESAFAARARFRDEVEALLPAFDGVFDAWAPGDTVLRIPRIELELRVASLDALAGALRDALQRSRPPQPLGPPETPAAGRLAVLERYLGSGVLEWHAAQASRMAASAELRETVIEQLRAAVARAPVGGPLEHSVQYYVRLLQLLPIDRWREAAATLHSAAPSRWIEARATGEMECEVIGPMIAEADAIVAIDAVVAVRARIGDRASLLLAATILAIERREEIPARDGRHEAAGADIAPREGLPSAVTRFFVARPRAFTARASPGASMRRSAANPRDDVAAHRDSHADGIPRIVAWCEEALARLPPSTRDARAQTASSQDFAILASHSGLVLLHPFLPRLFETCGLYRKRRLLAPARAATLLHWLATGSDEPYEFELGLVKVLLGQRPETPLAVSAGLLRNRDREEGGALLDAVIGHWSALQRTSIDALRLSFLQRRGALREDEAGWRLQLETASFDVLLGRLPWGIATVRLPWMTQALHTDWPSR